MRIQATHKEKGEGTKTQVTLERWDWPFITAEPCGFDHIEVKLQEPAAKTTITATIPLQDARKLGEHLLMLCDALEAMPSR